MQVNIVRLTIDNPAWADALALRRALLRTPLGLDFSAADLDDERADTLFAAYDDARLLGVVMLRPEGARSAKLRQMAVVEEARGQRVGEHLLQAFEAYARQIGVRHIGLAARRTAIGFYERLGYVAEGDEFIEVTLPHRHMSKTLL